MREIGMSTVLRRIPRERPATVNEPILTLIAQGLNYREVGESIGIAERTVKYRKFRPIVKIDHSLGISDLF